MYRKSRIFVRIRLTSVNLLLSFALTFGALEQGNDEVLKVSAPASIRIAPSPLKISSCALALDYGRKNQEKIRARSAACARVTSLFGVVSTLTESLGAYKMHALTQVSRSKSSNFLPIF